MNEAPDGRVRLEPLLEELHEIEPRRAKQDQLPRGALSVEEQRPEPEHFVQGPDTSRQGDRCPGSLEEEIDPRREIGSADDLLQVLVRLARISEPLDRAS